MADPRCARVPRERKLEVRLYPAIQYSNALFNYYYSDTTAPHRPTPHICLTIQYYTALVCGRLIRDPTTAEARHPALAPHRPPPMAAPTVRLPCSAARLSVRGHLGEQLGTGLEQSGVSLRC